MNLNNIDDEYLYLVKEILEIDEFNKLKNLVHHGLNRYDHSLKVSYYSYKISKKFNLNYESAAKAGLLHDFFITNNDQSVKDRMKSIFIHPKIAVKNSSKYFELTEKEENIIKSHMFPVTLFIPKYAESWVVSLVDKAVSIYEATYVMRLKTNYATNLLMLILLNMRR